MKKSNILFIGLDVHMESIVISLADDHNSEVRRYGKTGGCISNFLPWPAQNSQCSYRSG